MSRWIYLLSFLAIVAILLASQSARSQAQQSPATPSTPTSDTAIQRKELLKLQERALVAKSGADARLSYLQHTMETLTHEADAALATDKSIAANKQVQSLLAQRLKSLESPDLGSADDRIRTQESLATSCLQVEDRQELLALRHGTGALAVVKSEIIQATGELQSLDAQLQKITSRLAELQPK